MSTLKISTSTMLIDSAYEQNFTEFGSLRRPRYVEMPKSRVHRLFDRLRRKSKDQEPSPQEWLEVDESFDARTVGAERGGWESFREDEGVVDPGATTQLDPYNAGYENGQYDTIEEDGFDGPYDYEALTNTMTDTGLTSVVLGMAELSRPVVWRRLNSTSTALRTNRLNPSISMIPTSCRAQADIPVPQPRHQHGSVVRCAGFGARSKRRYARIHHRASAGATCSIIIDLDGLGAGDLCMIEQEGMYRTVKTSSRMKRYIKKASQATGLNVGGAQIKWKDSAAS